jgi:hypothetical protein
MGKQDESKMNGSSQEQSTVAANRVMKLLRALIKMREQCIMKPDESTYKIV